MTQVGRSCPGDSPISKPASIFAFLADGAASGLRGALVTIVGLEGGSPRSLGSHMAVLENGVAVGSLSSGCVEAAIRAEAVAAIAAGRSRAVKFGAGSPFIDIRLPCGGAMEILILVDPTREIVARAAAALTARTPVSLYMNSTGAFDFAEDQGRPTRWDDDLFVVRHVPSLKVVILGQGDEALAMMQLARAFGAEA